MVAAVRHKAGRPFHRFGPIVRGAREPELGATKKSPGRLLSNRHAEAAEIAARPATNAFRAESEPSVGRRGSDEFQVNLKDVNRETGCADRKSRLPHSALCPASLRLNYENATSSRRSLRAVTWQAR